MIDTQYSIAATSDARIGPNAIIQTAAALDELVDKQLSRKLLDELGYATLPSSMVPEVQFDRLVRLVVAEIGAERAQHVLELAGALTASYLLTHRIPAPLRVLLAALPSWLAISLLFRAIKRHAWTFVGGGVFSYKLGPTASFSICNNLLCRANDVGAAIDAYYRATFESLLRVLIAPEIRVERSKVFGQDEYVYTYRIAQAPH